MLDSNMKAGERAPGALGSIPSRIASPPRSGVWHRISAEPGYLRAELFNRQTIDETRKFLEAVLAAAIEHRIPFVLIRIRNSVPIFTVERYGFSGFLDLAFKSKYRIALVGDTVELRIAHQYIATMARMRGVRLRAFGDEAAAIAWLRSAEAPTAAPGPAE
jgi:hypothetical protein